LVRREFVAALTGRGAHVVSSAWGWCGADVEVRMELGSVGDLMFFRAVTTEPEWS
jgi:hypothetical protein